jgi:hypothetical protein
VRRDVAKITDTFLGWEDHGRLTVVLTVDYGGSAQGVGGYALDEPLFEDGRFVRRVGTAYGMEFVAQVMRACGVDRWEAVKGRTVYVLQDLDEGDLSWGTSKVLGIEPLPTERGVPFIFDDLVEDFTVEGAT